GSPSARERQCRFRSTRSTRCHRCYPPSRTMIRACSAAVLLAIGCSPSAQHGPTPPARTPPQSTTSSAAPARPAATQTPVASDEYAQEVVSKALDYVSKLRELSAKAPVRGRVISRAKMVDYVESELEREVPREVVEATGETLYALNTVPA